MSGRNRTGMVTLLSGAFFVAPRVAEAHAAARHHLVPFASPTGEVDLDAAVLPHGDNLGRPPRALPLGLDAVADLQRRLAGPRIARRTSCHSTPPWQTPFAPRPPARRRAYPPRSFNAAASSACPSSARIARSRARDNGGLLCCGYLPQRRPATAPWESRLSADRPFCYTPQ